MVDIHLSLRQRKLLHYIQDQHSYVTGTELANHLQVSARTIRSDVAEINENLQGTGISIISKRSLGYLLKVEDKKLLKELNQVSNTFLTRDDRTRHMAFCLCLAEEPINLYTLEDEMFISRTTLEHDLAALRKKYVLPYPHINYCRSKNHIFFEDNERKRRIILNTLFSENWNYNARGNAFYQYQYLDEELVDLIMLESQFYLRKYGIVLEDINMIVLNLAIAIACCRMNDGHFLERRKEPLHLDPACVHAADDLLESLEKKLGCIFPDSERQEIYLHLSCARLLDSSALSFGTLELYFAPETIAFANDYLALIREKFQLSFSDNEDFYITLLQYLRYLSMPLHYLNTIQTHTDIVRSNLLIEYEIAILIQPLALSYTGDYWDETELMYLAFCISGALEAANRTYPKLKTVIMAHLNMPASWHLKQKLLSAFHDYLELTALLPVYSKDTYDFSKTDLIITTANKTLTCDPHCKTLLISPFFTKTDQMNLEKHIFQIHINRLYGQKLPSLFQLLQEAFWHEAILTDSRVSIIELLSRDFLDAGYVELDYVEDLLRREAILPFAFQPGVAFLSSLVPSKKTCLSVATLEHRIKWNSYKIRTVILAAVCPGDSTLVFKLLNELYYSSRNYEDAKFLKTKEELLNFFADFAYRT